MVRTPIHSEVPATSIDEADAVMTPQMQHRRKLGRIATLSVVGICGLIGLGAWVSKAVADEGVEPFSSLPAAASPPAESPVSAPVAAPPPPPADEVEKEEVEEAAAEKAVPEKTAAADKPTAPPASKPQAPKAKPTPPAPKAPPKSTGSGTSASGGIIRTTPF